MKKRIRIVDMTSIGPVNDIAVGGYADFKKNFAELLATCLRFKGGTRVCVLVSNIGYGAGDDGESHPYRYNEQKVYAMSYVRGLWTRWYGKPFAIAQREEKDRFWWDKYKREAGLNSWMWQAIANDRASSFG